MNLETLDINQLLSPLVLTLLTIAAIHFLRLVAEKFLSKEDLARLSEIAHIAVKSAEQMVKKGDLDKAARLPFALEIMENELTRLGIKYDPEFLINLIESVVLELPSKNVSRNTITKN